MLKRYILTILWFSLLLLTYGLTLFPLVLVGTRPGSDNSSTAFLAWGLLVAISLLPAIAGIIRKVWFFKGNGEPIPFEALKTGLLMMNKGTGPVLVKEKRNGLVFSWNHQNPRWCRLMERMEIKRLYELHLMFDTATKTVHFSDRTRKLRIRICGEKVKTGLLGRPSPILKVSLRNDQQLAQLTSASETECSFKPTELKSPVLAVVLKSGWNANFHLL